MKHETHGAGWPGWLAQVEPARAFEALAASCGDAAVFAVDAERNVVFWSAGAEKLLGYVPDEMLGEHCLKANRCVQCVQRCGVQEQDEIRGARLEMWRKDGSTVHVRKHARSLRDADGKFLGAVEVLTEVERPRRALPVLGDRDDAPVFHGIVTRDLSMQRVFETLKNVAQTDVTVLLRGESGTGKELLARALHEESPRRSGPLVAINCAALTRELLESELFGHERGAFTGAVQQHEGVFERAGGGTLFLDEVAELPLDLQAKLLRVLEDRSFVRVGGKRTLRADVRVVAATHRSLRKEVAAGRFREDLMYRLRVVPIFVPPLRERVGDVPLLLSHFIAQLNARGGRQLSGFSPDATRALLAWPWPGNVRELRNVVEYAFAVARGDTADVEDLPPELREPRAAAGTAPTRGVVGGDLADRIRRALAAADGNVGEAARALGMSRATFWRKRRALLR